jgi:rhamnulokinase
MASSAYLAFDLGASGGRGLVGSLTGGRLEVRELSRFSNGMVNVRGRLHWDVLHLLQQIAAGLKTCAAEAGEPASVGVDTWGVDFALLASDGSLLGFPRGYRDPGIEGAMEAFFERVPREHIYEATGVQFLPINTLYQLYAMVRDGSPLLESASSVLMMPDLFNYLLTGEKRTEFTIATTSQLYNPRRRGWDDGLLAALGLSPEVMQEIVPPGTVVGSLDPEVARQAGVGGAPVMATASHDTAAAVASAPAEGRNWAYISSGTWSLMGVESERPIITEQSLAANFTNEGGVANTFRVLKNISGLWPVQECRRSWAGEREYSYRDLTKLAEEAAGFRSLIEPDHPDFLNPADMPAAIREFCQRTGQAPPEIPGEFVRCVLVSLALKYRMVLDQLRGIYPHPIERIHVVGGGVRNELLCQLTADATEVPVSAGPAEATAIGNLLVQAMGLGHVASPAEIRAIVRRSFPVAEYEPRADGEWAAAYDRFQQLHREVMGS